MATIMIQLWLFGPVIRTWAITSKRASSAHAIWIVGTVLKGLLFWMVATMSIPAAHHFSTGTGIYFWMLITIAALFFFINWVDLLKKENANGLEHALSCQGIEMRAFLELVRQKTGRWPPQIEPSVALPFTEVMLLQGAVIYFFVAAAVDRLPNVHVMNASSQTLLTECENNIWVLLSVCVSGWIFSIKAIAAVFLAAGAVLSTLFRKSDKIQS